MKGVDNMLLFILITKLFKEVIYVVLTVVFIILAALTMLMFTAGLKILGIIMMLLAAWTVVSFIRVALFKRK